MKSKRSSLSLAVVLLLIAWTFMPGMLLPTPLSVQPVSAAETGVNQVGGYDNTAVQAMADNWTRQSSYLAGDNPIVKWTYESTYAINGAPVIGSDGTIYFGNEADKFYALSPTGIKKWSFDTNGAVTASGAIGKQGTIYLTTKTGDLCAVNPDGSKKWIYTAGNPINSSPVIGPDGTVYFGAVSGELYAISPDGQQKWNYKTNGIDGSPSVDAKGNVYVGTRDGHLTALDTKGNVVWDYSVGSSLYSPVLTGDNKIYVASDKKLWFFSTEGKQKGSININNLGNIHPCATISSDGNGYIVGDKLYKFDTYGDVSDFLDAGYGPPVLVGKDGTAYFASDNISGSLYALLPDGTVKWSIPTSAVSSAPVLDANGTIYLVNRDGKITAIDTLALSVEKSEPADGALDIATDQPVVISFNKTVLQGSNYQSLNMVDKNVNKINVSYNLEDKKLTIIPTEKLKYGEKYTVRIPAEAFVDSSGHSLEQDVSISFTVKAEPGSTVQPQAIFYIGQKVYKTSGQTVAMDVAPLITDGRTVIPVGFLAKALGVADEQIQWNSGKQTVTISKDNTTIILTVGSNVLTVNGSEQQMDTVPFLSLNGRVYLPAGFVAKALGYQVVWNEAEKSVALYRPSQTVNN